ncbi:MAG: DUF1800 domain-containing protein [Proteobacteria bacterium]|nr:DUF1800 domain-containing protein [Pseudomonadota bacterium]
MENDKLRRKLLLGGVVATAVATLPIQASKAKRTAPKAKISAKNIPTGRAIPIPEQNFASMVFARLGWGSNQAEFNEAYFASLGADDASRLSTFVDIQLAGGTDDVVDARIAASGTYYSLDKSLTQLWSDYRINAGSSPNNSTRPAEEIERLKFLRALYTHFPLKERLADFWHNHFSIRAHDDYARQTWTSWDRDVIRGNMLGNFHQFLLQTAQHPAMLYYLDNYNNSQSEPNENYGRELFELHTLGAENYFGLISQSSVPTITVSETGGPWGGGTIQQGYVDNDVFEAARCLTGWRVRDSTSSGNTGEYFYDDSRHDRFQKSVLAAGFVNIPANQAQQDGLDVIELLAYHPGTAQHIAGKLCRYFVSDTPTQNFIDDVATVFYDNRYASNQLELTVKALFAHAEFANPANWQTKLKRPFDVVISAMNACDADFNVRMDHSDSNSLEYIFDDTGHFPFEWQSPDGYPHESVFWMSSTALIKTWRTVDWLLDRNATSTTNPPYLPVFPITESQFQSDPSQFTPDTMVSFWMSRIFDYEPTGGWTGDLVYEKIIEFVTQQPDSASYPPWGRTVPIPLEDMSDNDWPYRWHERLRGAISLIFCSPYFMQR